jgi:hypothetical protein
MTTTGAKTTITIGDMAFLLGRGGRPFPRR